VGEERTVSRVFPEWVEQVVGKLQEAGLRDYDACRGPMNDQGVRDWSIIIASQDGVFSHAEIQRLVSIASRQEVFLEIRGGPPRLNDPRDEHSKVIAVFHNMHELAKDSPPTDIEEDEAPPFDEDDEP
jgi:hypothetical protein